ncbi:MAG: hypothetical protein AAGJ46_01320 [Planctomycetota bacterium]
MRLSKLIAVFAVASLLVVPTVGFADDEREGPITIEVDTLTITLESKEEVGEAAAEEATCEGQACEEGKCEDGPCEEGACEDKPCEEAELASDDAEGDGGVDPKLAYATHRQTAVIKVNTEDLSRSSLKSFCLAHDGAVLAACEADGGEVRRFTADGEYVDTWELPIKPEAINVGGDGNVYVAGEGKLIQMSPEGEVLLEAAGPHVNASDDQRAKIRESVITSFEQSIKRYKDMADRYKERHQELADAVKVLEKNRIRLDEAQQRTVARSKQMADQWVTILAQMGAADGGDTLSEEEIEKRVDASLKSSMAVASISQADGEVFIATREATGYGFCVWRMNNEFAEGEVITKGLRGCCGQMDVQCCENGVYVAENSRHRVYHVSREGEELGAWGHGARKGLEGFGSCCNPMNVAFGPPAAGAADEAKSVYTAESGTGRIKRYTPEGELIELVGKVDIVPGCKKVSIAVDQSGDRVYMLDITRHHIVLMQRLGPDEQADYTETRTASLETGSDAG